MNVFVPGSNTVAAKVTHISSYGIWLLSNDKVLFLLYVEFPWFKDQPVKACIHGLTSSPQTYQCIIVRAEPVEGLNQSFLNSI